MITQTSNRSRRRRRDTPVRIAIAAMILAMPGCAEIEVSAEAYKTYAQANARVSEPPPAPPVLSGPARPDSIDPSMRPDPGAFHAADLAFWDGARTLPGIWIAHPTARTARRVRLTNGETGTRIDAAMFRRDPNLSGPRVVISSEAAERLGLAPGRGTPITIEGLAYRLDAEAAARTEAGTEAEPEAPVTGAAREPVPAPGEVPAGEAPAGETTATPVEPEAAPVAALDPAPPTAAAAARAGTAGATPPDARPLAGIPVPRPKPGPGAPARG